MKAPPIAPWHHILPNLRFRRATHDAFVFLHDLVVPIHLTHRVALRYKLKTDSLSRLISYDFHQLFFKVPFGFLAIVGAQQFARPA